MGESFDFENLLNLFGNFAKRVVLKIVKGSIHADAL
jgi:hypothetical protein